MDKYNPHAIESKWQKFWLEDHTFDIEFDEDKKK